MSFTVYRSSAGSGKTFTLVKEYLKIALTDTQDPPRQFRRILAITFTNKAAAEMKDRIIRALKELSADDPANHSSGSRTLLDTLIRETGFSPDVLRERAASVLKAILHNYSDFAIGTIDSFVHKVVRCFAFDLKLPANFEIELDSRKLLNEAISLLISKIGEDEELTRILVAYSESKAEEERSWHIETDLLELAEELMREEGAKHLAKLKHLSLSDFGAIHQKLRTEIRNFESAISSKALEAHKLIGSKHLSHGIFHRKGQGISAYFESLSTLKKDDFEPNSYVRKTIEEDKWTGKEATTSDIAALESIKERLSGLYHGIQEDLEKGLAQYRLYQLLNRKMYSLTVLNEINTVLEEYKEENAILHISEFNKLIAGIVFNEPIPFIYERLGERYTNYLIDEFQDTSILQWQNLLPLVDNALSEEQFTMVVGDGKQAIYRWRGGDVTQFANLPDITGFENNLLVQEREASLKRHYNPQFLGSNYRSKIEIIGFNNSLYRLLSENLPEDYNRIYDKLEQAGNAANTGGYVSIEFFPGDREEREQTQCNRILSLLSQLGGKNYRYGDVAILTRTNKEGNRIANFLIRKGIPVLSNDSLLLKQSQVINFLAACLRYLQNPEDEVAKAEMILFLSRKHTSAVPASDLSQAGISGGFRNWIEQSGYAFRPGQLLKRPLYQLCEELLGIFNLGTKPDPYLVFFLDEVLNFSNGRDNSLAGWNLHWEERREKASAIVPEGMDAVHIGTIHRAKGLEYPVVILPLNEAPLRPGKKSFWLELDEPELGGLETGIVANHKNLTKTVFAPLYEEEQYRSQLDNLNLLYVATTRPEERLYVLASGWKENAKPDGDFTEMLSWYIQNSSLPLDENHRFTLGSEDPVHINRTVVKNPVAQLDEFISTSWPGKIRIRSAARGAWSDEQVQKQDTGIILHTILSRIRSTGDLEPAIQSVIAEGLVRSEEQNGIRVLLNQLVSHPELAPFFSADVLVRNEAELLIPDGAGFKSFRPDRIVYMPSKTIILDYKTGKEMTDHHEQVENYASILRSVGTIPVQGYLVYTDEMRVVKV